MNKLFKSRIELSDITDIIKVLLRFKDERDCEPFHNSKDLAVTLNLVDTFRY